MYRKQKASFCFSPAFTVARKPSGGDQAVDMNMLTKVLAPGVEYKGNADLAANPAPVTQGMFFALVL